MQPRVIGVVAGRGGVGATTTAIGIGTALAASRDTPVVLVDARAGTAPLSGRLGTPPAPGVADIAKDPWGVVPVATVDGLNIVDGADWSAPANTTVLADALGVLAANHGYIVIDVGTDLSDRTLPLLAQTDVAVVVLAPDRDAIAVLERASRRLAQAWESTGATGSVAESLEVAVVARTRDQQPRAARLDRTDTVVAVPYDRSLAGGAAPRRAALRAQTWQAYVTLAAYLDDGRPAR